MIKQRLARADDLLQDRDEVLDVGDLLLVHQDISVLEDALHRLRVGDEVRREIAAIELHAFDDLEVGLQALALFDGDHAVLADLFHGVGQDVADLGIAVGGHRADLGDRLLRLALDRHFLELADDVLDGLVHPALHLDRVDAGDDRPLAFVVDGLGENRGGGRAVTGDVGRLAGDFANHAGAHVLELVRELDFSSDGHAVLGDGRRAEAFLNNHIAAARAERDANRLGPIC